MAAYIFNKDSSQNAGKLFDFEAPSSVLAARGLRGASSSSVVFPSLANQRSESLTSSTQEVRKSRGRISKGLMRSSSQRSGSMIEFTSYEELSRQLKTTSEFELSRRSKRHISEAKVSQGQPAKTSTITELAGHSAPAKKGPTIKVINPIQIKLKNYQVQELNDVYDILADPNTGMVHIDDLNTILRGCGSEPKEGEVDEILDKIRLTNPGNHNQSREVADRIHHLIDPMCNVGLHGYLTLNEIIEVFKYKLSKVDETKEMERAFRRMDLNGNGRITFSDLKQVAELVNYNTSDEQLTEMMAAIDKTGNGIGLGKFIKFMTKKEYYDF